MQYALSASEKQKLRKRIEQNKRKLSPQKRIALVKEALKGDLTQGEVAERFGVSRTTVQYHVKRAVAA